MVVDVVQANSQQCKQEILLQIDTNTVIMNLLATSSTKFLHNFTLIAEAGWAANANARINKYSWKIWQILVKKLAVPNWKTGGARQAAVATQQMDVWKFCRLKVALRTRTFPMNPLFYGYRPYWRLRKPAKKNYPVLRVLCTQPTSSSKWVGEPD